MFLATRRIVERDGRERGVIEVLIQNLDILRDFIRNEVQGGVGV